MPLRRYRVVQPYGKRPEEWTEQGTYETVGKAFAALDSMTAQMVRTGSKSDAIELIVVDDDGNRIQRSVTH